MNNKIFYFFYNFSHQSVFLDKLIIFLADIFPYIVVTLALLFLFSHHEILPKISPKQGFGEIKNAFLNLKQKWIEIVLVFFSGIVAWFLAYILKNVFMTSRPFLALPDVTPLWVESGFAFPSGHATFFMALGFAIYLTHKKIGYIFISFAILIGLARIIAGVHFPVDILGGFILGIIVAYLVKHLLFFQNRLE